MKRAAWLVGVAAAAVVASVAWRRAHEVTFSRDVAPIVWAKCAPCHRPGEAGPFSLLSYEDVRRRAKQIARVTASRFMPPWKPLPGAVAYANERGLTPDELSRIQRWIADGAPLGRREEIPPLPRWPTGWQLGHPDVVVKLAEPFTVPADGPDVYRNFVIRAPVAGARFVRAWEFRPGTRSVHHAILNLDRYGWARARDAQDAGPGFAGMDPGDLQAPDGFYLVWTPGQAPTPPADGMSWPLDGDTDLVLQLHLQPSGKPEVVDPTIGLFFADAPPEKTRFTMRIGDAPLDIPPGVADYTMRDEAVLPADVHVYALFPHAHYLARRMRCRATLPDGRVVWLLAIDDWDPAWQQEYVLRDPAALPRGTTVAMEFVYDNTAANPRNPNDPPARVVTGERTVDEMGNITFELGVDRPDDKRLLREWKYRRQVERGGNARAHYNLANTVAEMGRGDEAIALYRRAIELDPALAAARFNLGLALLGARRYDEAVTELRAAVAADPRSPGAHTNLGAALNGAGRRDEALAEFRAAVAIDPAFAPALNSLGVAALERGRAAEAATRFTAALESDPRNALSRYYLGNALRLAGDRAGAAAQYRESLALAPGLEPAAKALAELSTNVRQSP